jgi:hypothetical protein
MKDEYNLQFCLQTLAFSLRYYPCRCLCLGFLLQIMRTIPRRLITRQFSHRRFTDARTCTITSLQTHTDPLPLSAWE